MTDETPSDAQLSRDYDPRELVVKQEHELELEERRVTASSSADDPGEDYEVPPPIVTDDDSGYDPLPS